MRTFRRLIFWTHLIVGVTAGLVVLVMSVTGVLLTYERQIIAWADTRGYDTRPTQAEATRLPIETLIARVKEQRPDAQLGTITVKAAADAPVTIAAGRDDQLFINAYTGTVLGSGSPGVRAFFRSVTDWHRWLAMSGDQRQFGRNITGACNLGFLFLVVSGPYLWWPRGWTWQRVRNVTWFKRGLSSKARDFNWHNTIGFWSAIPLAVIVAAGVVMSYPWANALVYRLVGEEVAVQGRGPGAPASEGRDTRGLNALWARAEQVNPAWTSISLRLPATFTIDSGDGGQPQYRTQVTFDAKTGDVARTEGFSSYTRGRQLRTFLRFAHTGEYFGVLGQTIAGLVTFGAVFLAYTGLALAFRRLLRWWRAPAPTAVPASVPAD